MHSQTSTQNYRNRGSLIETSIEVSDNDISQVYLFKIKMYNLVFVSIRIQHVYLEHQKKSYYKKGMSQKEKKKNNGKNDTGPQGGLDCGFRKLSETNFRFICQFCVSSLLLSLQTVLAFLATQLEYVALHS